ncbi:MAG: MBL fold metallo-hydrolase [Proteobacteria bacterium]|nr:MBL fold metallo-hydrolase [Pseudomonadota bacterium]
MKHNNELKLHFINVGHGDATIIEFPDYGSPRQAHFGVVDFGAETKANRKHTTEYMNALVKLRKDGDDAFEYSIDFVCVTHPHNDHYGGLRRFLDVFADKDDADNNMIGSFWDCGFRTNSVTYNKVLDDIARNKNIVFTRVAAGSEFKFGETRVTILGPSVDLRNRFDTFGINKNNASIVLKIKFRNSYVILAGDAQFASWGKVTEEFPRQSHITFFKDALGLAKREETSDQLKCNLLRTSHHGSKHGTSLEYLERIKPKYVVTSAGDDNYYRGVSRHKAGDFPHQLVKKILDVLDINLNKFVTGEEGNIIFRYDGGWNPISFSYEKSIPGTSGFLNWLENAWG